MPGAASKPEDGSQETLPLLDQLAGPGCKSSVPDRKRKTSGVVSVFADAAANMKAERDKLKEKLKETGEKLKETSEKLKASPLPKRPLSPLPSMATPPHATFRLAQRF